MLRNKKTIVHICGENVSNFTVFGSIHPVIFRKVLLLLQKKRFVVLFLTSEELNTIKNKTKKCLKTAQSGLNFVTIQTHQMGQKIA